MNRDKIKNNIIILNNIIIKRQKQEYAKRFLFIVLSFKLFTLTKAHAHFYYITIC